VKISKEQAENMTSNEQSDYDLMNNNEKI
jgi:hypothetical protein